MPLLLKVCLLKQLLGNEFLISKNNHYVSFEINWHLKISHLHIDKVESKEMLFIIAGDSYYSYEDTCSQAPMGYLIIFVYLFIKF